MPKTPTFGAKKRCKPRGIHAKRKLLAELSPNIPEKDVSPNKENASFMSEIDAISLEKARKLVEDAFENPPPKPNTSRGLNVEAATALLHSLEEDGDDFNMEGFEYDEVECETAQPLNENVLDDVESVPSAIERKMSICPTIIEVDPSAGYYELIHSSFLEELLLSVACPTCLSPGLSFKRPFTQGLASKYTVYCADCADGDIFTGFTSPAAGRRKDINVRTVLALRESDISHPRLKTMFAIMSLPVPLNPSTYADISQEIHKASLKAADDVQKEAAAYIAARYADGTFTPLNENAADSKMGVAVSAVTFDGAWQTRGYSAESQLPWTLKLVWFWTLR